MPRIPKSKAMSALHEAMGDLHRAGAIGDAQMSEYDQMCLGESSRSADADGLTFQVFADAKGEWRWRLVAANGKRIASSGEGYKSRKHCLAAIELVKRASTATIAA